MKIYTVEDLIKTFGFAPGTMRKKGLGTQQGLADYFGLDDRSTVSKWLTKGEIPLKRAKHLVANESVKINQLPLGV